MIPIRRLSVNLDNEDATRPRIGLILLAAGGATRMGRAKQLFPFNGLSMLRRAAVTAVAAGVSPIIVVLGADAEKLTAVLHGLPVAVAVNSEWATGIGSSIREGLRAMQLVDADVDAVVITLCDQPLVGRESIHHLVEGFQTSGKPIVVSKYQGTLGAPVLFDRRYFSTLLSLADEEGAQRVIFESGDLVHSVELAEAAVDVDTPSDYQQLLAAGNTAEPCDLEGSNPPDGSA